MATEPAHPCHNHPEKESRFLCMKYDRWLCEACLKCQDPKLKCKFRIDCVIWEIERKGGLDSWG